MPASRWAMPVLITGKIPVSTTLRISMPAGVPEKFMAGSSKPPFLPEREVAHAAGVGDGVGRCSADEVDDRRRRRHGESAQAGGLGNGAVAQIRRGVGNRITEKVKP